MRTIDRYVIRQILLPFLLALAVFTFVFVIPWLIEYAETFIAKGVAVSVVVQVMLTLIPQALALTIPMALLVGLLVGFNRLSTDREFVAMQACGIGLLRLLRPVGLVAGLAWAATSYVLIVAVPQSNQAFREIAYSVTAARAEGEVRPRVFFDEFPNLVLYVREIPDGGGWRGVFMADNRPGQTPAVYVAERGQVHLDRETRTVEMVLQTGSRHTADAAGAYEVFRFDRLVLSVDPESVFPRRGPSKGDNEMTMAELRARIAEHRKDGIPTHPEEMALHRRFSIPVACLVFGILGIALGATNRRDGTLGSFVLGLGVIFAYYIPLYLGPAMAKGGLVAPWLAVWMPNLVLGVIGAWLFGRRDRAADQPLIRAAALFRMNRLSAPVRILNRSLWARWPALRLLDRYVAMTYARVFFLCAMALLAIFYIATFIDMSDKVFKGAATFGMLATYLWYATPQFVYYVLPLSVLMATLVTIAVLTKSSELVVMKACGVSLYRVALPLMVCACVAASVLLVLEEGLLGSANRRAEPLKRVMRGGAPGIDPLNRRWLVASDGSIYHYEVFDSSTGRLLNISTYEFVEGKQALTRRTFAERATFHRAAAGTNAAWTLENGWVRQFDADGQAGDFTAFKTAARPLEPIAYFGTEQPDARFMGYGELQGHVAQLQASGLDVRAQRVALERKVSFPFVPIVMALIAIPFAVSIGRGGAMAGIGVGIGLAMTYWTAYSVFAALGAGGVLTPTLAAWAANILFGAGAVYLGLRVRT
jgi:LPS export ABC transporter permease LptF/LPS export ABC transporter permease LptG